jgi:hypothetical protein
VKYTSEPPRFLFIPIPRKTTYKAYHSINYLYVQGENTGRVRLLTCQVEYEK